MGDAGPRVTGSGAPPLNKTLRSPHADTPFHHPNPAVTLSIGKANVTYDRPAHALDRRAQSLSVSDETLERDAPPVYVDQQHDGWRQHPRLHDGDCHVRR
jgi:hypothetical protein